MRLFQLVFQALLVSHIHASGPPRGLVNYPLDHLTQPLPTFTEGTRHSYDANIKRSVDSAFDGYKSTMDARKNARAFNAALKDSRFRTLAEIVDTVVPQCGVTSTSGKSFNVTGMTDMVWQNDMVRKGFRYHGPCEAWIDKTRVYHSSDCRMKHKEYPARILIDYSLCKGDCVFKFYWVAVDYPGLKAYKQCAKISNNPKATKWPKQPVQPKSATPTIVKPIEQKRNGINRSTAGDAKLDSTPVDQDNMLDDKTERRIIGGNSPDNRDDRQGFKRGMNTDEKDASDGNYHRHDHLRHHHAYDNNDTPKHQEYSPRPTTSQTKMLHNTVYVHNHGHDDSIDPSTAERDETKANDKDKAYKVSNDNSVTPKARDYNQQPTPPSTQPFTTNDEQLQHHDAPRRTPQLPADPSSLVVHELATTLHQEGLRHTPQPLTSQSSPTGHVPAALPRHIGNTNVIQQHSAAQTPPPTFQASRVDHLAAL